MHVLGLCASPPGVKARGPKGINSGSVGISAVRDACIWLVMIQCGWGGRVTVLGVV